MTKIFQAKTLDDGYTIKILAELLQNIVKTACFHIHRDGIDLSMTDSNCTILVDIKLRRERFNMFKLDSQNDIFMGINIAHLHKMLKSMKKKESLSIYIDDDVPDQLCFVVCPKDNNKMTKSSIYIQDVQNVSNVIPTGYEYPVIVPSNEYQRTLKDMMSISDKISICIRSFSVLIRSYTGVVFSREALFGEIEDESPILFEQDFGTDQFRRLLKVSSLNNTLQLSGKDKLPLKISTNVGSLGEISIFIKSEQQIKG